MNSSSLRPLRDKLTSIGESFPIVGNLKREAVGGFISSTYFRRRTDPSLNGGRALDRLSIHKDRSARPVGFQCGLSRTFVRNGDDFADHGRHGHPTVDLADVVPNEQLAQLGHL